MGKKDQRKDSIGMSTKKNSGASRSETLPPLTQSLRKQSLLSHQTQEGDRTSISPSPVDNGPGEVKYSIDAVIAGKEVEELRITEETLKKVRPPKESSTQEKKTVTRKLLVRKRVHQVAEREDKIGTRNVAVLKPLPQGSSVGDIVNLGAPAPGPRLDETGTFIPHSLLGEVEDYTNELHNTVSEATFQRTVTELSSMPPIYRPPTSPEKVPPKTFHERHAIVHESNALDYWRDAMAERRRYQEQLAEQIGSSPSKLTMNHGDGYRAAQEQRTLIDRAMPLLEHGKGYRVGSEFYSQGIQLGDIETGIRTAVTLTEGGHPPELELVGVPDHVRREKGLSTGIEKNVPSHYTWGESVYLANRRKQLEKVLTEIGPHHPDFPNLQVIGHSTVLAEDGKEQYGLPRVASLDSLEYSSDSESETERNILELNHIEPLASQLDIAVPMLGPALSINKDILKWEGAPRSATSRPKEFFVSFTSEPNRIVRSSLPLVNCGTTAMYYSWQKVPRANSLQTRLSEGVQRFYFDTRGGVLLPGETLAFEFMFKADKPGVFTEYWSLCTGPVLCGGRPIYVKLTGIAHTEDAHVQQRNDITNRLMHKVAVTTAHKLINQIIDSICSPPRTPSPELASSCLEEDIFIQKNPQLYYSHSMVAGLRRLYMEVMDHSLEEPQEQPALVDPVKTGKKEDKGKKDRQPGGNGKKAPPKEETLVEQKPKVELEDIPEWDLSVEGLQELILGLEEEGRRETKLAKMNTIVGLLSFPPPSVLKPSPTSSVRKILNGLFDSIECTSLQIRQTLGLPILPFTQSSEPDTGESVLSPEPGQTGKDSKKKSASKEAKKPKGSTEKKTTGSSVKEEKGKASGGKKSRQGVTPSPSSKSHPPETKQERGVTHQSVNTQGDSKLEGKYKEQFHTAVYQLLSQAMSEVESALGECS